jgi:hypothetical protein
MVTNWVDGRLSPNDDRYSRMADTFQSRRWQQFVDACANYRLPPFEPTVPSARGDYSHVGRQVRIFVRIASHFEEALEQTDATEQDWPL